MALTLLACGDDVPTGSGTLRFGQIGEVRLFLETPLLLGEGSLEQELIWSSQGPFLFGEKMLYREEEGGRVDASRFENPDVLAGSYAQWVAQVNEVRALDLFVSDLDPELDPDCGPGRTRLTLEIVDEPRGESISWVRCTLGSLGNLSPSDAGPDPQAARVVSAAILLRDQSVGEDFLSAYNGSVPFSTIDRGEDTKVLIEEPFVLTDQAAWEHFWGLHAPESSSTPEVDFLTDLVIVGAVGIRQEAGDSIEIRRVLPVDASTVVTLVEKVPGDFCAPAERIQAPFHIVRAPRIPLPLVFANVAVERVPCGL